MRSNLEFSMLDLSENILSGTEAVDLSGQALFDYKNKEMNDDSCIKKMISTIEYSPSHNKIMAAPITSLNWKISTSVRTNNTFAKNYVSYSSAYEEGELTKELIDEVGDTSSSEWECKGCSKYFSTKASLKRHHDRKLSCKEISEKNIKIAHIDSKVCIVDWVEKLLYKSISGDSEKPYCAHCDVEFANKSNLHKHLTKSPACDTLAKIAFLESMKEKSVEPAAAPTISKTAVAPFNSGIFEPVVSEIPAYASEWTVESEKQLKVIEEIRKRADPLIMKCIRVLGTPHDEPNELRDAYYSYTLGKITIDEFEKRVSAVGIT